jgi:S-adenosylmethionine synthetase
MAKHVVAAHLASKCETQLVFSIGQQKPFGIGINCFGTEKISEDLIVEALCQIFPLTVSGIINELGLRRPIFQQTSFGGHFGRVDFPWEQLPHLKELEKFLKKAL